MPIHIEHYQDYKDAGAIDLLNHVYRNWDICGMKVKEFTQALDDIYQGNSNLSKKSVEVYINTFKDLLEVIMEEEDVSSEKKLIQRVIKNLQQGKKLTGWLKLLIKEELGKITKVHSEDFITKIYNTNEVTPLSVRDWISSYFLIPKEELSSYPLQRVNNSDLDLIDTWKMKIGKDRGNFPLRPSDNKPKLLKAWKKEVKMTEDELLSQYGSWLNLALLDEKYSPDGYIAERLLDSGKVDYKTVTKAEGMSPLMLAAKKNFFDITSHLINNCSVDLHKRDKSSLTALDHAKFSDNDEIIKLIEDTMSTNLQDWVDYDLSESIQQIKSIYGSLLNEYWINFDKLSESMQKKVFYKLINHNVSLLDTVLSESKINIPIEEQINNKYGSLFNKALLDGNIPIVESMLAVSDFDIDYSAKTNEKQETSLMLAIATDKPYIVKHILSQYSDNIYDTNSDELTALDLVKQLNLDNKDEIINILAFYSNQTDNNAIPSLEDELREMGYDENFQKLNPIQLNKAQVIIDPNSTYNSDDDSTIETEPDNSDDFEEITLENVNDLFSSSYDSEYDNITLNENFSNNSNDENVTLINSDNIDSILNSHESDSNDEEIHNAYINYEYLNKVTSSSSYTFFGKSEKPVFSNNLSKDDDSYDSDESCSIS